MNLHRDFSAQICIWLLAAMLFLQPEESRGQTPFLQFPIAGFTSNGNGLITSCFDHFSNGMLTHEMPGDAEDQTDDVVHAHTGEEGRKINGTNPSFSRAHRGSSGVVFSLGGDYAYVGTAGAQYLAYDGHPALDFGVAAGTPVVAAAAGTVIEAGWANPANHSAGLGQYIKISHPNGYYTIYGHLSRLDVAVNSAIGKGEQIGLVGSTGNSTGAHLHFQVRLGNEAATRRSVDPYGYNGVGVLWEQVGGGTSSGTYGTSNAFAFDTRDSNSAHFGESSVFLFDTRDSNSTHYGESNVFAFNTRAIDGFSGSRASGMFSFDTRSTTATGLTVNAPPGISGGVSITLSATATFSNGLTEDVSDRAAWSVTGGPANTRMIGRTLHTGYSAIPVTAFLQARYWRNAQQIASPLRPIIIGPALNVTLSAQPPVGVGSGATTSWTLTATAAATGGVPPFSNVQWRWRGNDLNATSLHLAESVGGPLGTGQLDVTVIDANGKIGTAFTILSLNKAPVTGQPLQTTTTLKNEPGTLFHGDGTTGVNLRDERKNAGLLVIAHGLIDRVELPDAANPCGGWMVRMADAIETKLSGTADGPPNVVLFDWHESANPSKYRGTDAENQAAKDLLDELGDLPYLPPGLIFAPVLYDALTPLQQKLTDIRYIREIGERQGVALAKWIETQISAGKISTTEEIHLVGHSAGGFVVATCAARLLTQHAIPKLLVTTLDTPMFRAKHIKDVKNHGARIERYNSMLGGINPTLATIPDRRTYYPSLFLRPATLNTSVLFYSTPIVIPDAGYRVGDATSTGNCPDTDAFAMHSEAHEWYIESVGNAGEWRDGFYFSPFLGNTWSGGGAVAAAHAPPLLAVAGVLPPPPPDQLLSGFQTFGQVTQNAGEFTLTELDDAGIFLTLTVPIGATDLKFRARFDQIGDGDFLEVSFGDRAPLAVIDGLVTTAGQWIEYEIPTHAIAGESGTLVFRLASRGASNAVVRLDSLAFVMSDDPDGDGLSNSEETLLGADPLVFDSDGDGLSDGFETQVSLTNALLYDSDGDGVDDYLEIVAGTNSGSGNSVFSIKSIAPAVGGGVAFSWTGRGGSTYRGLRSATPDFASFDVIAAAVPGVAPLTSYTDATLNAQQTAGMFYRVEVAEAPVYAANMAADSHGDGIPDGWELDRGFNADLAADGGLDTDGDGSSTLLEFALGTDPRVNSHDGIGIYTDEDGYLTLTTNRNPVASGLQLRIAVSGDLATWHSDAAHVTTLANTPSRLKARDNIPLGSAPHRFIRLEVIK